jgi:secreted trypsin-like serine protease
MPRSFVKGSQVEPKSVAECDLGDDAVITRVIKDKNVTEPKLADDISVRLLGSASPIARTKLTSDLAANTDFTLPGGLDYTNLTTFLTRTKVYQNGQLLFNGADDTDLNADVIPGSTTTQIKFICPLRRGAAITVEIL